MGEIDAMNQYPGVREILSGIFSVETGLTDYAAREMFRRVVSPNKKLRDEIEAAFQDTTVDWRELLCNERYEICETESQQEAHDIARKLLELPVF